MYQAEYCPVCDKKTLRKTYPCDCQKTAHNSEYAKCPCCGESWNIEEHDSCQCGAFIKKRL